METTLLLSPQTACPCSSPAITKAIAKNKTTYEFCNKKCGWDQCILFWDFGLHLFKNTPKITKRTITHTVDAETSL